MISSIKRHLSVASIIATSTIYISIPARADGARDPYTLEILGFHLGMTPDEVKQTASVKIDDAAFDIRQGPLSMGTYKSAPLVFGVGVSSGRDKHVGDQPDQERLFFVFDQRKPYKTLYIRRVRTFSQEKAPTISQLSSSLADKYGQAAGNETNSSYGQQKYIWTYNSIFKYMPRDPGNTLTCLNTLSESGFAGGALFGGSFRSDPEPKFAQCGTWMQAIVGALKTNPDLVGRLEIEIGDIKSLRESDLFTMDMMKKGAEGTAADEKAKAAANKAPL